MYLNLDNLNNMGKDNYYIYIVPQTGKVYKCADFSKSLEKALCNKYGRIFAVSGYSKSVKIISPCKDYDTGELETVSSFKELKLDRDFKSEY